LAQRPVRSGAVPAVPTTRADWAVSSIGPSPGGSALGALSVVAGKPVDRGKRAALLAVASANLPWRIRGGIDYAGG